MPMFDLAPATTEIFLAGAALALLMVGAFRGREPGGDRVMTLAAVIVLMVGLVFLLSFTSQARTATFGGQFVTDRFAVYFKVLVLVGAAVCLSMSSDFLRAGGHRALRVPGAGAVLDRRHADDDLGQQPDRALPGTRAAEPAALRDDRVPSRPDPLDRGRAQVFRARRARLGPAAVRLLAGLRLHRHAVFRATDRSAASPGPTGSSRSASGR